MVVNALKQVGALLTNNNTAQHTTNSLLRDIIAGLADIAEETALRDERLESLIQTAIDDNKARMERLISATQSRGQIADGKKILHAVSSKSNHVAQRLNTRLSSFF